MSIEKAIEKVKQDLEAKISKRALRKVMDDAKKSGEPFGYLDSFFNSADAEMVVTQAMVEELNGVPMPPPLDSDLAALGGGISSLKKKLQKASKNIARALHKTMRKLSPIIFGLVVSMIAGPVVGKLVAGALSNVASKHLTRKVQESEIKKIISKLQKEALDKYNALEKVPLGMTQKQIETIIKGEIPKDMTPEDVWHSIEQAKLIQKTGLKPIEAYIAHFHTYQKDAPPKKYMPKKAWDLLELLNAVIERYGDAKIAPYYLRDAIEENPLYKKYADPNHDIFVFSRNLKLLQKGKKSLRQQAIDKQEAIKKAIPKINVKERMKKISALMNKGKSFKEASKIIDLEYKIKAKGLTPAQAAIVRRTGIFPGDEKRIDETKQKSFKEILAEVKAGKTTFQKEMYEAKKRKEKLAKSNRLDQAPYFREHIKRIRELMERVKQEKETFPGRKYEKPVLIRKIPENVKGEAIKTIIKPNTTKAVIDAAKKELAKDGVKVESPEAEKLLELEVKKVQKDIVKAVNKGTTVPNAQPVYIGKPAPSLKVEKDKVLVEKEKSNIGPLLLTGIGLALALKGG